MMTIIGMLCPHCDEKLFSVNSYEYDLWIGVVRFTLCEPCQRFFYILSDHDNYPVTIIDAEPGMGPGDPGYTFDPVLNGSIDEFDREWDED